MIEEEGKLGILESVLCCWVPRTRDETLVEGQLTRWSFDWRLDMPRSTRRNISPAPLAHSREDGTLGAP